MSFRALVVCGRAFFLLGGGARAADVSRSYLTAAMAAMGGEAKLRAIKAINYHAVGTRAMVWSSWTTRRFVSPPSAAS